MSFTRSQRYTGRAKPTMLKQAGGGLAWRASRLCQDVGCSTRPTYQQPRATPHTTPSGDQRLTHTWCGPNVEWLSSWFTRGRDHNASSVYSSSKNYEWCVLNGVILSLNWVIFTLLLRAWCGPHRQSRGLVRTTCRERRRAGKWKAKQTTSCHARVHEASGVLQCLIQPPISWGFRAGFWLEGPSVICCDSERRIKREGEAIGIGFGGIS